MTTAIAMKQVGDFTPTTDGHEAQSRDADEKVVFEEAMLVAAPQGQTQRGLKSRHIQFL